MNYADIARAVRAAAASTETQFIGIGGRLETSVETIAGLTQTFNALLTELNSENLRQATIDLADTARSVARMAQARSGSARPFADLTKMITAIETRTKDMAGSVRGANVLAINAKIAAASIDDDSVNIGAFAAEMNVALGRATANLDRFAAELSSVRQFLHAALATQTTLETGQSAAVQAIPLKLGRSVDALAQRSRRAAKTAATVGKGSQRVGQRISEAVMALQIGDSTRQRIEHVDAALGLFADLPPDQQINLTGFFGRLQAAQLTDTAESADREMVRIMESLRNLAGDAQTILSLGSDAFGASDGQKGTFLGELAEEVRAVDAMLAGFVAAQKQADSVADSVSQATVRLLGHIKQVRSLEAEIHIMGLNMTFKSGRLGIPGRPLAIIAQELRMFSNKIANDANVVMSDLDRVVATAGTLAAPAQTDRTAEIESIATGMAASMDRLASAGDSLAQAWTMLERDGQAVAGLLRQAAGDGDRQQQTSAVLRTAARDLANGTAEPASVPPDCDFLLDELARSYTMDAERRVLASFVPGRAVAAPTVAADEDIFF